MSNNLEAELVHCQIADEYRLRRQLHKIKRRNGSNDSKESPEKQAGRAKELARLEQEIARSRDRVKQRDAAVPDTISFPEQLPVSQQAEKIKALLQEHQVLVVAGDTGSGKTTQLPKLCLAAGLGRRGLIGHTQPRRLAAVSVANRIAEELGTETGQGVAYQVRFNEKQSPSSYLKVMTDGILLAEIQQDRFLNRYEVLIVDEAHERSLNIDFLLGFLKQLLQRRKDLKLIITSATIDVEKFSRHFADAPIVEVAGRTFPVEVRYEPITADRDATSSDVQADAIVTSVREILNENKQGRGGDILVFLSGEREIRETAQALRKQRLPSLEILPLYARLRHSEQTRIFQPHKGVRVVLATNVAETSLTVPGINYVIDTGLARISRYSLQSKVQRLPIEPVSQASANQRKGRCGRLANGICIRLYSESDFQSRPEFTDPEIRRTNLGSVILRMKHLRLGEPDSFPFIEPPESRAISEGIKLLTELDALDAQQQLTAPGKQMAALPVDPRLARMLITAAAEHCLAELLIIVSVLGIQDPREIGADNRQQAQQKLEQFDHPESDFLTLVNLWHDYEKRRQELNQNQLRKYCKTHFLSFMRMREWREVHRQLLLSCQQLGLRINKEPGSYEQVHRSIISGSLNQIAARQEGKIYLGNRNRKFTLFPGSILSRQSARWIVTGELIETTQTFATMAARIQPEWVEQMALHLVKREHYQPHWSKKRQEVMAYEKVQLYGITLLDKVPVSYGKLDPQTSREIFIRDGLAANEVSTQGAFYKKNKRLLGELAREEEKIRRPEHIVSERDVVQFYERNLPGDIYATRALDAWLKKSDQQAEQQLTMSREKLLGARADRTDSQDFPDQVPMQKNQLRINYKFDPGADRDGATIEVPKAILGQLTQADIDWAVPGIMREKCIALLKGLPKATRKNFIPVSGFVDEVLPAMSSQDGDLIGALLAQIRIKKQLSLSRTDFNADELPRHLLAKIRVVDDGGNEAGFGADLGSLQEQHGETSSGQGETAPRYGLDLERDGLKDFDLEHLPEQVTIGDDLVLERFPALVDDGDHVHVQLFADPVQAQRVMAAGLTRLYMLRSVQQRNMLRKQFSKLQKKHALVIPVTLQNFPDDAVYACYQEAFAIANHTPRTREQFEECLQHGKSELHKVGLELEQLLEQVLKEQWKIRSRLVDLDSDLDYLRKDVTAQLDNLLYQNVLRDTPLSWLQQYPRYLQAVNVRLDKIPFVGPRDYPNTEELQSLWQRYGKRQDTLQLQKPAELERIRWLLEEYRVSLFAQQLGTREPVSAKRLEKAFAALEE